MMRVFKKLMTCYALAILISPAVLAGVLDEFSDEFSDGAVKVLPDDLPDVVRFNQHIRPIMSNTCFACHGPDESKNESGLRLDSFESVTQADAIVPGDAMQSVVLQRIMDADDPMPPVGFRHQLTGREKALFRKWIDQGAMYEVHWSYAPIGQPEIPSVKNGAAVANPIDAFVLRKLESLGVVPNPTAGRRTLLRRLSLDLTGLPPTRAQLDEFLGDDSRDAYEKQVDRLLASPHYGERMAINWLDIVRFSDTVGFHGDQNQHVFPYRDYVINSLNSNQPFNQFTIEQIAGDLMPEPGEKQLTATGLVRLNMMTREGGAQPEEYLAKYTADRVRMVGTAWLGATLGCCECHDHKYDPFSIKDFYAMGAYFDDVRQWGVYNNYGYTPNPDLRGYSNDHPFPPEMRISSPSLRRQIKYLETKLDIASADQVSEEQFQSEEFKDFVESLVGLYARQPSLWMPVPLDNVTLSKPEASETLEDGSLLFFENPQKGQAIKIVAGVDKPMLIKSFKVQVDPHGRNDGFVGRTEGKFATSISLTHVKKMEPEQRTVQVKPRYVRVELPGRRKILSLAEIQVFDSEGHNLASSGVATQSSVEHNGPAELAIDGDTNGEHGKKPGVTHTKTENSPWWELDLLNEKAIDRIVVWNRTDGKLESRLGGFQLVLLNKDRKVVFQSQPPNPKPSIEIEIPETVDAADLMRPESIAYGQADRYLPSRYSSGKPNKFLSGPWRSGPARWHLPADESRQQHNAVFHLNQPVIMKPGDELIFKLISSDIGRFKIFTSSVARPVVDATAGNPDLMSALASLANVSTSSDQGLGKNQKAALKSTFYRSTTTERNLNRRVIDLRDDVAECYSGFAMTMVCQPTNAQDRRSSRVLARGDWKDKSGELVQPATPRFLPTIDSANERGTRLDLANWIVSPSNPLTARHYVNRTWKHFFGTGLSNVLDDLGSQGGWPSHPDLLDWLAGQFRRDWDRKRLTKLIVMSNTYRQAVGNTEQLQQRDPENRWLARQTPRRLEAEIVRDNALAIAGLLDTSWIGGRSVFPYQPPGYYANIQFPGRRYTSDTNGLQYRRGLYMHWQRTFLHPMLTNFDAPSRDECAADRILSNSPQQALTLLNDPVFVEASKAFALRLMMADPDGNIESWLENGFRIALSRLPFTAENSGLMDLYSQQFEYFQQHGADAKRFCANGQTPVPQEFEPEQVAALSQVCRVILNLHEVITRY